MTFPPWICEAIVVDVDLEKFLDRVDHDILIGRLRRKIPNSAQVAANGRQWWRNSGMLLNSVLTIKWADRLGVAALA